MGKALDWESRIGRRVRLRDLHILFAVIQHGSMAKAGAHLGMSQSAVSQAIAAIEHALRVPLLDRTSKGVTPTIYGSALLRRGSAAFDELRLGVQEIENLADPATGDVRIAATESIAAGILPRVIERLSQRYPRIKLQVFDAATIPTMDFPELRERRVDVRLTILLRPLEGELAKEYHAEILRYDRICLAVGSSSPWARRRKIDLSELAGEPWIIPLSDGPGGRAVTEAFRTRGLPPPQITVMTFSVHLRNFLAMSGRFIVAVPVSILELYADVFGLTRLPVEVPMAEMPYAIVRLRNRTLSPTVELFMQCLRDVTKSMPAGPDPRPKRARTRRPARSPRSAPAARSGARG
jgi:DNA-binding transcriptional LysR family regulator